MLEVVSLLVVLLLSLVIARIAAVALTLTGMSRASAQFQTRSALTGAGFTTTESEAVVSHPVRRRIIMWLMFIGNGGLVIVAALLVVLVGRGEGGGGLVWNMAYLLAGVVLIWLVARSRVVDRWMSYVIERALRRYSDLDTRDYAGLLHLWEHYEVVELKVEEGDWLTDKTLQQLNLAREGVLVLAVMRPDNTFIGAPRGSVTLRAGDTLLLYGRDEAIGNLDQRRQGATGNFQHVEAIAKQKQKEAAQPES